MKIAVKSLILTLTRDIVVRVTKTSCLVKYIIINLYQIDKVLMLFKYFTNKT